MLFTIAILCYNLNDALRANEVIMDLPGYQKMFIFYGEDIEETKLNWITKPNFYFAIPEDINKDSEAVAIRAGIILPSSLATLFIKGAELPAATTIWEGLRQLTKDPIVIQKDFWGVRKEFIILNGLEGLPFFGSRIPIENDKGELETFSEATPEDIRKAITGDISNESGIAKAITDTIPINKIYSDINNNVVKILSRNTMFTNQYSDDVTLYVTDNLMSKLDVLASLNSRTFIMIVGSMDELPRNIKPLRRFRSENKDYLILNSNIIKMLTSVKKD